MKSDRYADEQMNIDGYTSEAESSVIEISSADETEREESKSRKLRLGRKPKSAKADSKSLEEHDLYKMKKKDLLEIMLAQSKEIDSLRERVADLEEQLANREFEFSKIGSIAEASLAVTNIFKEAEDAARIYLENIRRSYEKRSKQHSND